MPVRRSARRYHLPRKIGPGPLVTALLAAPAAVAGPPVINGTATVEVPQQGSIVFNLRDVGAISGSAPLTANIDGVFVDGERTGEIDAQVIINETVRGAVCVELSSEFFSSTESVVEILLSVENLGQQVAGPALVQLTQTPGPTTGSTDPACGDPNTPPVANAGTDQTVADTDAQAGEPVTLNGTGSTDVDPDNLLTYTWTDAQGQAIATGATADVRLPDGVNVITLTVTDDSFDTQTNVATDTVTITVAAANQLPVANGGGDRSLTDTDSQPGEDVTLDGSQSTDADGSIASYAWYRQTGTETEELLGTGQTLNTRLPDGANTIRLQVTDNAGGIASGTFTVTVVAANQPPIANAGVDRSVVDSDSQPGEIVALDGSQSTDTDGTITAYQWFLQGTDGQEALGSGVTLSVRLPDGVNIVRLDVTDDAGNTASDTVQISVAAPSEPTPLAELPNLSPNQQKMATALDRICDDLRNTESSLTANQQDLLARCDGLQFDNSADNQRDALNELNGDDFAAARTQTLLFANMQYSGVMDRLMALRGGAAGLSIAGLNIIVDGKSVPLASIEKMVRDVLGGGASADADEPGGLLSDRWGFWLRGNYSFGDKEATAAAPSFDAEQWALLAGIDYRLSDSAVLGGSLSYGNSNVDFNPRGEGSLETESWAASLYGSVYAAKNFYFDAIVNVAPSDYEARRNITYVDGAGLVSENALGNTDGLTLSGGLSGGYDFLLGGLTVSPTLGVFYIDAQIDGFAEEGAGGLDLVYDEQKFKSLTANVGLRMVYAWKTSWGVVLPHLRADFVREFEDDVNVFGVRFAADPEAGSTPPILVETDNPDTSYWRFAGGLSAQFRYGISGYVEYQRLESFQYISFEDVSIGLRMQHAF